MAIELDAFTNEFEVFIVFNTVRDYLSKLAI